MIDSRAWRVGTHYGIHVYAENPPGRGDDEPLFTAQNPDVARQIVNDHNMIYRGDYVVTTKEQVHSQRDLRAEVERLEDELQRLVNQNVALVRESADWRGRYHKRYSEFREAHRKLALLRRGLHDVMGVDEPANGCATPAEAACE